MSTIGTAVIDLLLDDSDVNRGTSRTEQRMRAFAGRMSGVAFAARAALGTGAAGLGASVWKAAGFEQAMSKVATLLDDQTMHLLPQMGEQAKQMARDYGQSTDSILQGAYDAISAGYSAADAMDIVRVSTVAAAGGFTTTDVALDGLTSLMMAYQQEASEAAKTSDKMAAAVLLGKMEYADLAGAIGSVAPAAKAAGVGMDQLLAGISTITATGASTDEAVTLMLNAFKAILKPQEASARAAEAMGIQLGAAALQGDNFVKTMAAFRGMGLEEIYQIIPDQQAARAVAALSGGIDMLKSSVATIGNSTGAAGRAANEVMDDTAFKFAQLKQEVATLAGEVGNAFLPVVNIGIDKVREMLPAIREWAAANGPLLVKVTSVTGGVLGMLAVLPKVIMVIGSAVGGVKALVAVLTSAAGPVVVLATALGGTLAAAFVRSRLEGEKFDVSLHRILKTTGLYHSAIGDAAGAADDIAKSWAAQSDARRALEEQSTAPMQDRIEMQRALVAETEKELELLQELRKAQGEDDRLQGAAEMTGRDIEAARRNMETEQAKLRQMEHRFAEGTRQEREAAARKQAAEADRQAAEQAEQEQQLAERRAALAADAERQASQEQIGVYRDWRSTFADEAEAERAAFAHHLEQRVSLWQQHGLSEQQIMNGQAAAWGKFWDDRQEREEHDADRIAGQREDLLNRLKLMGLDGPDREREQMRQENARMIEEARQMGFGTSTLDALQDAFNARLDAVGAAAGKASSRGLTDAYRGLQQAAYNADAQHAAQQQAADAATAAAEAAELMRLELVKLNTKLPSFPVR